MPNREQGSLLLRGIVSGMNRFQRPDVPAMYKFCTLTDRARDRA